MSRFEGAVALITGAAGGIGSATATRLAAEGAAVALVDRKLELLGPAEEAVRAAGAPAVLSLGIDQTDREAVDEGVKRVADELGGLSVVVANAGYGKFSPFLETSQREWGKHVDINLTGTFNLCQATAREIVARGGGGAIVITASSGAVQYTDQLSAYCATKAAVRMLAIGMASELGVHRIRVNVVMPGVVESPMTSPMLENGTHRDALLRSTPAGRLGRPEDVAALVSFLASPEADYVCGESVMIDGGQRIHGHPQWFSLDYRQAHEDNWAVGA